MQIEVWYVYSIDNGAFIKASFVAVGSGMAPKHFDTVEAAWVYAGQYARPGDTLNVRTVKIREDADAK